VPVELDDGVLAQLISRRGSIGDMLDIITIASRFRDGPNAKALVCSEVLEGAPILWVCRKHYIWQFGCGRDHSDGHVYEADDDPRITTVLEIVARDPSVAACATLNDHHIAYRRTANEPWVPHDDLSLWWF